MMVPLGLRAIVKAMGRVRFGALAGIIATGAWLALSASNCASPTEIVLDIRADNLCGKIKGTGVVVTTPDRVDMDDLEEYEGPGCESSPADRIGTLTITPSGGKDSRVGIRVVSGVTKAAHECKGPQYGGCVVARRTVRFVPGEKVPITIIMSDKCLSKDCGKLECNPSTGACIAAEQILNDGGLVPEAKDSGSPADDANTEDAPIDAPPSVVDAGPDACAACSATGMTCDGVTRQCTIDCSQAQCVDKTLCGPGLDCTVQCLKEGLCRRTRCAGTGKCTFNCSGGTGAGEEIHCSDISCASSSCAVTCQDTLRACNGVFVDGGTNEVKCISADKVTCDNVNCSGGTGADACKRTCGTGGVACGPTASCSPLTGCGGWENAAIGDGG
jgi:hypothetical protein